MGVAGLGEGGEPREPDKPGCRSELFHFLDNSGEIPASLRAPASQIVHPQSLVCTEHASSLFPPMRITSSFLGGGVILVFLLYIRRALLPRDESWGNPALSPFMENGGDPCSFSLTPGGQACEQVWPRMGFHIYFGLPKSRARDKGLGVRVYAGGEPGSEPAGAMVEEAAPGKSVLLSCLWLGCRGSILLGNI